MEDITIPGTDQKMPVWILVVGVVGVFVMAIISRSKGPSGDSAQSGISTDLLASELNQRMREGWEQVYELLNYLMNQEQGPIPVAPPGGPNQPRPRPGQGRCVDVYPPPPGCPGSPGYSDLPDQPGAGMPWRPAPPDSILDMGGKYIALGDTINLNKLIH